MDWNSLLRAARTPRCAGEGELVVLLTRRDACALCDSQVTFVPEISAAIPPYPLVQPSPQLERGPRPRSRYLPHASGVTPSTRSHFAATSPSFDPFIAVKSVLNAAIPTLPALWKIRSFALPGCPLMY